MPKLTEIVQELRRWYRNDEEYVEAIASVVHPSAQRALDHFVANMPLKRRSGRLASSFRVYLNVTISNAGVELDVDYGTEGVPYASVHEYGAVIHAKNKFVKVPGFANQEKRHWRTPFSRFTTKRSRRTPGNLVILDGIQDDPGGWGVHMFTLARGKVKIPARLGFGEYFDRWWAELTG